MHESSRASKDFSFVSYPSKTQYDNQKENSKSVTLPTSECTSESESKHYFHIFVHLPSVVANTHLKNAMEIEILSAYTKNANLFSITHLSV